MAPRCAQPKATRLLRGQFVLALTAYDAIVSRQHARLARIARENSWNCSCVGCEVNLVAPNKKMAEDGKQINANSQKDKTPFYKPFSSSLAGDDIVLRARLIFRSPLLDCKNRHDCQKTSERAQSILC
jgi:hypothetical protein